MSSTASGERPLTRSVCAAAQAADDTSGTLRKHRCTVDHASPVLDIAFPHPRSPISRLSNDELLLIFEEALHSTFTDPATYVPPWKPALTVTISHVCRLWQGIALSHSYLWTYILPYSLPEVERHLLRSATRPLMISCTFPTPQVTTGSPHVDSGSTAIVNALVQGARRWQALHWYDCTVNGIVNVIRLMKTPNTYPMLENLVIMLRERVLLGNVDAGNANAAVLFPALKHLHLIHVHPMFLPLSPMPALQFLKLQNIDERLLFSQLFSLLYRSPALCTLDLHLTLPMIDSLGSPLHGTRFTLPRLAFLSLYPAPAAGLQYLFDLLHLPSLRRLDLHLYASPHSAYWPFMTPDGRVARIPFSQSDRMDGPLIRLAALRSLSITYCIPAAPPTDPPAELPLLQNIVFPALVELKICHTFVLAPPLVEPAPIAGMPPPQPLRPLDALFHVPLFTHVTCLVLARCALPLTPLCDALSTRFPALEVLDLHGCPGAGPLMCALAPGACECGCERPGSGDAWIGAKVHEIMVRLCDDVRAGCLRKVIEARLNAGCATAHTSPSAGAATAANSELEVDGTGAAEASGAGVMGALPARLDERAVGSDSADGVPQKLVMLRVLECAWVTKEDAGDLAAIPGAPMVTWMRSGSGHEILVPGAAAPDINGSA